MVLYIRVLHEGPLLDVYIFFFIKEVWKVGHGLLVKRDALALFVLRPTENGGNKKTCFCEPG